MVSVHYHVLRAVFPTGALFHLQYRTHYLFSSSSKLWFYPSFQCSFSWRTDDEERGCGEQGGWTGCLQGDFTVGFDFVWGMGQGLFQDKESPSTACTSTHFLQESCGLCMQLCWGWGVGVWWTDQHDPIPGSRCDCEHLLELFSLEINLQCDPWSVRGSKTPREDDLQRAQPLSASKLHTVLSIDKGLSKIYNLTKSGWNLVGMDELIHLTKAILPWSPKSNLLL